MKKKMGKSKNGKKQENQKMRKSNNWEIKNMGK